MIIKYNFQKEFWEDPEEFEYEIDLDQLITAISYAMADYYIYHLISEHNLTGELAQKLFKSSDVLAQSYAFTLNEYPFLITTELINKMHDSIKAFWEDEARKEWKNL